MFIVLWGRGLSHINNEGNDAKKKHALGYNSSMGQRMDTNIKEAFPLHTNGVGSFRTDGGSEGLTLNILGLVRRTITISLFIVMRDYLSHVALLFPRMFSRKNTTTSATNLRATEYGTAARFFPKGEKLELDRWRRAAAFVLCAAYFRRMYLNISCSDLDTEIE